MRAWQDLGEDEANTRDQLGLSARQLQLALAYYREFGEEIRSALALARRPVAELQSAYPFFEMVTVTE